jgi:hypothetical protein
MCPFAEPKTTPLKQGPRLSTIFVNLRILSFILQDQPFFNKALNMLKGLKVGILPQRQFPAGCLFFADNVWREAFGDEAALVHNNWIVGHDVKRQRFQNLGIWYVKEDKAANGSP